MYILQKLKPGSLPLEIELHQPGIHFYHVLKKSTITSFKVFLTKMQIYWVVVALGGGGGGIMMSKTIGKLNACSFFFYYDE